MSVEHLIMTNKAVLRTLYCILLYLFHRWRDPEALRGSETCSADFMTPALVDTGK